MTVEEALIEAVKTLPLEKQVELLERLDAGREAGPKKPRKSGRGLWADLNVALNAEDIDETRREMWGAAHSDH
jgi:hypothetical protein